MKENLKSFFVKLVAISIAVIIIINLIFNILLGERLEKIDKIMSLSDSTNRAEVKKKIRSELEKGLEKDYIFSQEDKILIYKIYKKIKKEFFELEKNNN
jgi:predicted DNA-binding transcriptional regulator|tara:strand:+ start:258 stop:554 length:297 start_codon:yes stop_codon:yes gene_type:complete